MSPRSFLSRAVLRSLAPAACALGLALTGGLGCVEVAGPAVRSPDATKWLTRAERELQVADLEEARDSVAKALSLAPEDEEVRLVAAQVHLALLDYAEAVRLLKGIKGTKAAGLRGRALWYKGDLEAAADQLEAMLNDPDVVDDWAKSIAKLARRGAGRTPFSLAGGRVAMIEMPHVSPSAPYFVVPVEIDGEPALALVSTGYAEVVIDSQSRAEPSWVSLRFQRPAPALPSYQTTPLWWNEMTRADPGLEVQDVPALSQDLSGVSKMVGAPIKAILGVNLLRHVNATIDYTGRQFIARSSSPSPPPDATRVPLYYLKGGGMLMKSNLGDKAASLLIDTAMALPVTLDDAGWEKAGVAAKDLKLVPDDPEKKLKEGLIPLLKIGTYEITGVPGYETGQVKQIEEKLTFNLDGMVGNGLLAYYRITLADGGRLMWLEDNLSVQRILSGERAPQPLSPAQDGLLESVPSDLIPDPKAPPPSPGKPGPAPGSANPPPK
ncbi:MAG: tetratricopeptide repeat protein [Polyangiaceae bacterium]